MKKKCTRGQNKLRTREKKKQVKCTKIPRKIEKKKWAMRQLGRKAILKPVG
jgi:hypothetical protein